MIGYDKWKTTDPNDREPTPDELEEYINDAVTEACEKIERTGEICEHYGLYGNFLDGIINWIIKEMGGTKHENNRVEG